MIDPLDRETLDLVEACAQPMSGRERAKRHREKKRREREAGQRAELDLKAPELAVMAVALGEFRKRWARCPSKAQAADALLPRLPVPDLQAVFPGDSAWLPDALRQGATFADWPAHSSYQADSGFLDLQQYRQTPLGQPEVDSLVFPGDTVWTSYGSGPYVVREVAAQGCRGMRCFTLALVDLGEDKPGKRKREANAWINEVVAVDGRLLKLFANNCDEVFIARRELASGYIEDSEADAVRAECRRIVAQNMAAYSQTMDGAKPLPTSFDELVLKLLPFKDRQLLEWAQRNEQQARETPLAEAYPESSKKRSLLGQALTDKVELNGRYQVLLEQAIELYELVDLGQHTPRLSNPAAFLREYKRYSEGYAINAATEGAEWARKRFKGFGKAPAPGADPAELAKELAAQRAENQRLQEALQQIAKEVSGGPVAKPAPSKIEAQLREEIAGLQREQGLLIAERGKANDAVSVLQERLEKAGLPSDYRRQPGE
ncbi:hypothetical protein [Pseudomonas sp. Au-Pse12]|uniref:hypothetical protein n=1 Tax=Pseudomonas sp. Au-Pse12 TaxID=2906459 RepID=UPI001E4F3A78|nr:hypothetical protein [Pseudomonas sp. Au-Pse12]MCE4058472.1 hypothetical protein [Pseudomonas sp. Au-Pse12]